MIKLINVHVLVMLIDFLMLVLNDFISERKKNLLMNFRKKVLSDLLIIQVVSFAIVHQNFYFVDFHEIKQVEIYFNFCKLDFVNLVVVYFC